LFFLLNHFYMKGSIEEVVEAHEAGQKEKTTA